jgi:hypothetical protein
MARNPTLDEMREELGRRRRRHQSVALAAGEAEAEYRHRRALKIKEERAAGHPATLCEYHADADPEIYALHKVRLRLAARERVLFEACRDLREGLGIEQTQTVNERTV